MLRLKSSFSHPVFITVLFFIISNGLIAQNAITIKGKVIEGNTEQPIPYATVVLRETDSEEIVAGGTTNEVGAFEINYQRGDYYLEVSFIGFTSQFIRDLIVGQGNVIDLGTIILNEDAQVLQEVEVRADKSMVEFELDKRVFNVGQDLSSTGIGALDLLNNVPSVNVDIEGQISLRGNTGVQILINGKPSVLADDGANALATLTADMIEKVEVITNPSAKYEAEGSSGIINIVLKKEEKEGFNGSVSLNTGTPANHNVGVSLNRRTDNFNFFTQFGGGYRSLPRFRNSTNLNLIDSTEVRSDGTEYRNERFFNIRLGTDYYINALNVITLSGSFAFEDEDQPSTTNFWITNGEGILVSEYQRKESTQAANPKYQYDLQYEKKFKNDEDHVLLFTTQGNFFGKEQSSEFSNVLLEGVKLDPDQETETEFYQRDFIFKLDYTNPISDEFTLEVGSQYDINDVGNDYAVLNEDANGDFVIDSNLTNNFEFDQKVLGVYATGAYQGEKWGVKVGARIENTNLNTYLITTDQSNQQNYTNLFPSFHTSYKLSKQFSIQAGYSRRIYRPRLWDLNPFFNIRNNYNIRRGNPLLQPEYADSYEMTAILIFEKFSLNTSIYNLYTTNIIERVSFFEDNRSVTAPVNIGTRNQTGLELNGKYVPNDWFTLNGDFNYGFFIRNGSYGEQNFDFTGTQWSTRLTSRFKLPAGFEVEATGDYRSSYVTVQGEVSGFAFADIGLRKKLWKGKGVINVSVRDIFASRIRENTVNQPTFVLYDFAQRGRFITLGFSYSFGKGEAMTYNGRRR
jgi:outer membrane receptor protein involved in Fe transport